MGMLKEQVSSRLYLRTNDLIVYMSALGVLTAAQAAAAAIERFSLL